MMLLLIGDGGALFVLMGTAVQVESGLTKIRFPSVDAPFSARGF